jgi:hypothetical protein
MAWLLIAAFVASVAVLAAIFRRKVVTATVFGVLASLAALFLGRVVGWFSGALSLQVLLVVSVVAVVGVLVAPRRNRDVDLAIPEERLPPAEPVTLSDQDEAAFRQWLDAHNLVDVPDERLNDLRRQFAAGAR